MNQHTNRKIKSLTNFDYYSGRLDHETLLNVKQYCKDLKSSNNLTGYNEKLAGFIQDEHEVCDDGKQIILPHIYKGANDLFERPVNWKCDSIWVNYQKKYEVNPLHNHTGVLSFVLWINIPYDLDEELNLSFVKHSTLSKSATAFTFVYSDIHGTLCQQPFRLNKQSEGRFIIFHSKLFHMVYPFYTSDDYRISIAGNLEFN